MDGVGDVGQGLAVDLLVPVQHLPDGLVALLDLGPAGRGLVLPDNNIVNSHLNSEWRIWNLSLDLKYSTSEILGQ